MQLFDLAVIGFAFGLATFATHYQREATSLTDYLSMNVKIRNFVFFTLILIGSHIAYSSLGLYKSRRLSNRTREIGDILKATAMVAMLLILSGLLFGYEAIDQEFLGVFVVSTMILVIGSRFFLRWFLAQVRSRGSNLRFALIVGTNPRAVRHAKQLEQRVDLGYRVLGFVDDEWLGTDEFSQNGYPLVTGLAGFTDYIRDHTVDEVFIELPVKSQYQISSQILAACEEQGIIVRYVPEIFSPQRSRTTTEDTDDGILITIYPHPGDGWQLLVKRLFDILVSLLFLLPLTVVFVVTALLLKCTSPGPILFIQERVGLNKRKFRLYKFRTMVADAEKMQHELESLNEMTGPVFKMRNDPRITPVGRFLRKTSIDELPQLFNVLKGDMSLVGPRPLPVRDFAGFDEDWQRRRFSVRPGITCLWQISGRNDVSFDRWMKLDMQYIDQWSLRLDLSILARTLPAILRCTGAR